MMSDTRSGSSAAPETHGTTSGNKSLRHPDNERLCGLRGRQRISFSKPQRHAVVGPPLLVLLLTGMHATTGFYFGFISFVDSSFPRFESIKLPRRRYKVG